MAKYTIEYTRSVRVREYETLRIGLVREYDTGQDPMNLAFAQQSAQVEEWIKDELVLLQKEGKI